MSRPHTQLTRFLPLAIGGQASFPLLRLRCLVAGGQWLVARPRRLAAWVYLASHYIENLRYVFARISRRREAANCGNALCQKE